MSNSNAKIVNGVPVQRSINKKMYSVYDSVSETYSPINLHYTRGEAVRSFEGAVHTPDNMLSKHPQQFTLFELGEFDLVTGLFVVYDAKIAVLNGAEVSNEQ